jgi:hypothetical protein
MNISTILSKVSSLSSSYEVSVNLSELSQDIIESPQISGLYLGWVRKDNQKWEPLVKMTLVEGGYTIEYTSNHEEISALYPSYRDLIIWSELNVINQDFPLIFLERMPLLRNDVKKYCKFLKLDYPQIDKIAYVSRSGGRICNDQFSICPIVKPNIADNYIFYCTLNDVETRAEPRQSWQQVKDRAGKFQLSKNEDRYYLEFEGIRLGYLEDYFELIDGEINQVEIINFTDPSNREGYSILLKITINSKNAYANKIFQTI